MANKRVMTVAQLVRALGLHGKVGEKAAKEALAQLSATGDNGKQRHALTLPGIEQKVGSKRKSVRSVAGSALTMREGSKRASAPPKKFRLVYTHTSGIRQVRPPASKSRFRTNLIRDAVVTASIGE